MTAKGVTLAVFGGCVEFDLGERFPLVTLKETRWKTAFLEMLWFLRGDMDTEYLHQHGCALWDVWARGTHYGWRAAIRRGAGLDLLDRLASSVRHSGLAPQRQRRRKPEQSGAQRNHLSPGPQLVQVVRPLLYHRHALVNERGPVVSTVVGLAPHVGELGLNHVNVDLEHLA